MCCLDDEAARIEIDLAYAQSKEDGSLRRSEEHAALAAQNQRDLNNEIAQGMR